MKDITKNGPPARKLRKRGNISLLADSTLAELRGSTREEVGTRAFLRNRTDPKTLKWAMEVWQKTKKIQVTACNEEEDSLLNAHAFRV